MSDKAEWKAWYGLARWKRMRQAQFRAEPLCAMCAADGLVVAATTADHKQPHRGNPDLFWDAENLASLCTSHHSRDKQRAENGRPIQRIDADGWPVEG